MSGKGTEPMKFRVIDSRGKVMFRSGHFQTAKDFRTGCPSGCKLQQRVFDPGGKGWWQTITQEIVEY
jgi:hypothetical protein